jgi:hypothetical protein
MDVTKAPPFDPAAGRAGAGPASQQSAAPGSANLTPPADRVDIQVLDTAAALQILIAEVRADLGWAAEASTMQSPAQASLLVVQMFLQAVPDPDGDIPDWAAAAATVELALRAALDRAVEVVERWRDVPQSAVDAVRETRAFAANQLSDDASSRLALRPEWLALLPRLQAFRRRRRLARRGLIDPDSQPLGSPEADSAEADSDRARQD